MWFFLFCLFLCGCVVAGLASGWITIGASAERITIQVELGRLQSAVQHVAWQALAACQRIRDFWN